ncbi:MAG TPA: hypothetical protein VJU81_07365 [Methylomirabilota bacterium]|nr:hypothetical protein [Methylomirabilota bacterium]
MTTGGAFGHQHGDPRTLAERIDAQLRARVAEAAEMASLDLLVALRAKAGRPAPADGDQRDRDELTALGFDFLVHLRAVLAEGLSPGERADLDAAERRAEDTARGRALAGHSHLARRLPDYWQRFERERTVFAARQLAAAAPGRGWLRRLLGSS